MTGPKTPPGWFYFAMVVNVTDETDNLIIYVNGEKLPLNPTSEEDILQVNSTDIILFNEIADEITIWDKILTKSQIETIYTYSLVRCQLFSKLHN